MSRARLTVVSSSGNPRPKPDAFEFDTLGSFHPAPEVWSWIEATFLKDNAPLRNPDHQHLSWAHVGALWTNVENTRRSRRILATAEIPNFRGDKWSKGRQDYQLRQWFGSTPDFMLTFDAQYALLCSDTEWCALVEHELYHCAQALNEFGAPRLNRETGAPIFTIRGHDIEEFVGVVRRYGVVGEDVRALVDAAAKAPEVAVADIQKACGTCLAAA